MKTWYIENHHDHATRLSYHLSEHLATRYAVGRAVIIAPQPLNLLCVVRRYWAKKIRSLKRAYASTIDPIKQMQLTREIIGMEMLRFDAIASANAHVIFITQQEAAKLPARCTTVYITTPITTELFNSTLEHITDEAYLVDYSQSLLASPDLKAAIISTGSITNITDVILANNTDKYLPPSLERPA